MSYKDGNLMVANQMVDSKIEEIENREKERALTEDERLLLSACKRDKIILDKLDVMADMTGRFEEYEKRSEDFCICVMTKKMRDNLVRAYADIRKIHRALDRYESKNDE